ncbi:MAG: hypothetical protein WA771_00245 [Chthoniobacterales bacterium]
MTQPTPRIEVAGSGVGEISEATIQQRAGEIAIGDGRQSPNEADIQKARRELHAPLDEVSADPLAEETPELTAEAELTPGMSGHQAENHFPDEGNVTAKLTREGMEEADRNTRTEAGRSALDS